MVTVHRAYGFRFVIFANDHSPPHVHVFGQGGAEAERRGARSLRTEPRARAARYDRRSGRVHVDLTNGCSFAFPARNAQGLERASDAELAEVEVLGLGLGLHWERLDVDLSVPGLLAGLFGTRAWMDRQRAARAGAATSAAKAAAARRNGAKGGRPRKAAARRG
jgi:uncharacterized protein DUF2442/uncharacterized protein DUF4160